MLTPGRGEADPAMGRPRVGDLVLPRMHVARVCLGLSDRECEDQAWDPATMRPFVGVAPFEVPDATTPREFRHLPGRCGVVKAMVSSTLRSVAEGGLAAGRRQEALAASSSTSSIGSRTCSGCGRRATGGSPRCPTRPSSPSPQPAA